MRFDIVDLRLFLAVVDAGSITHGALAANLSLAAASERLREMEAVGGVPLLNRNRRGVAPTRAGDALAHHARLVLRQIGAMQAELSEYARGFRGSVQLLANSAAMTQFLPERLGPFLAEHPQADIDLAERPSLEIVKAVASGLAELGIISDAIDSGSLSTVPFAVDRLVLVMARHHPLAQARRAAFSQIIGEPLIGFDGALQKHIEEQAERLGHRARPRIMLRTFEGICRMAADGAGIGIVPETAAQRARRTMALSSARLTDPWATRRLRLCFRSGEKLEPLAHLLLDHLSTNEDGRGSVGRNRANDH